MANIDHCFKVKRGRPRKNHKTQSSSLEKAPETEDFLSLSSFLLSQKAYLKENFSQRLKFMIVAVSWDVKFPSHATTLPLLNLLEEASKSMLLTEVELVVASSILNKFE